MPSDAIRLAEQRLPEDRIAILCRRTGIALYYELPPYCTVRPTVPELVT